jgi:hypothetical protein
VDTISDAAGNDITAGDGLLGRYATVAASSISANEEVTLQNKTLPIKEWNKQHVSLEEPSQFYTFMTSYSSYHKSLSGEGARHLEDEKTKNSRRFFDTDYATEDWFHRVIGKGVVAFNSPLCLARVRQHTKRDVTDELDNRATVTTDMYWLDLRDMDQASAMSAPGSRLKYAVGAVVLLEFRNNARGVKVMYPTAIRLGTMLNGTLRKSVFIRGKSTDSAWRFALMGAACAFTQFGVGIAHIFNYHVIAGAFQWNFYNTLSPQHRLHNALKHFTKYIAQFNTHVLTNKAPLPPYPFYEADTVNQTHFLPIFAGWERLAQNFPYYTLIPSTYLSKQGIFKENFSMAEDWDLFPLAKFQLAVEKVAMRFVGRLVNYYYKSDREVQDDLQLQEFVAAMQDSQRGNVKVTRSGRVQTTQDLKAFLTVYMYGTIVHGSARMHQYIDEAALVPNFIASFMDPELILSGDRKEYSLGDILKAMPDSKILGQMVLFLSVFRDTKPIGPAFPNGRIDDAARLYDCTELNKMWQEALKAMTDIFAEGFHYHSPPSHISQWPLNQEA